MVDLAARPRARRRDRAAADRRRRGGRPHGGPRGGRGGWTSSTCPKRPRRRESAHLVRGGAGRRRAGRAWWTSAPCSTPFRRRRRRDRARRRDPEVFREEATERLDRIVETLLALEAGRRGRRRDRRAVPRRPLDQGQRRAWSAARRSRAIAHAMEDALEDARERGESLAGADRAAAAGHRRAAARGRRRDRAGEPRHSASCRGDATPRSREPPRRARRRPKRRRRRAGRRAPLDARCPAEKVDRLLDAVGETVLHSRRLEHLLGERAPPTRRRAPRGRARPRRAACSSELQDSVIQMRTLPLSSITAPFPRAVRDLAAAARQAGRARDQRRRDAARPGDPRRDLRDRSVHLLRNAVAHGIEPPEERERAGKPRRGRIELRAEQRGGLVAIEVADDGRGVAPELLAARRARRGSLADVLAERRLLDRRGGHATSPAAGSASTR